MRDKKAWPRTLQGTHPFLVCLLHHRICGRFPPMGGIRLRLLLSLVWGLFCADTRSEELLIQDDQPLQMPAVGACGLRIITSTLLELTLVTTKPPDPAPVREWDFVSQQGAAHLPGPQEFSVLAGTTVLPVTQVGFKRRVLYAPL